MISWLLYVVLVVLSCTTTATSDVCTYSEIVERKREAVKVQLLAKLKINKLPNNTRNDIPPDILDQISHIYQAMALSNDRGQQRDYTDDRQSRTKQNLIFPESVGFFSGNTFLCEWAVPPGSIVENAVLHIPPELHVPNLKIYIVNRLNTLHTERPRKREAERLYVDQTLEITEHWRNWSRDGNTNHGILFCVGRCYDADATNVYDARPFITVETPAADRERRYASSPQTCSNFPKKCCHKDHYLSFKELGMDHLIIEPEYFNAGLCLGVCQEMWLQQYYHSLVLAYSDSDRVCCSPASLADLQVLTYNNETRDIRIETLPNMVVQECGCK